MAFQKQPDRRRDVFAGRREEDELAAKIQRVVFIALDGSSNSQRMSQAVWRLVKRYRPVAKGSGARIALKNAAERRRVLERLERRALNLARDIDRVERDGQLSHAFERLFDLSKDDGHPPGFPDNARILDEGDLDRQFWETLQLAYAARH